MCRNMRVSSVHGPNPGKTGSRFWSQSFAYTHFLFLFFIVLIVWTSQNTHQYSEAFVRAVYFSRSFSILSQLFYAKHNIDNYAPLFYKRVIIQVQSFIIKCLSFRQVSFVQGYRLCIGKLCTCIILSFL